MPATDARIDAYIEKSANFAKPILQHIRTLVHHACPQVQETIKWGMPFFDYKGIMCNMAAFKQHCSFGFMNAGLMKDATKLLEANEQGMGHFNRLTSINDLPADDVIIAYIHEVMWLKDNGVKVKKAKPVADKVVEVPAEITTALQGNKQAAATFENFAYSHKKEYIEWITEAKTEATRTKRKDTMLQWLAEGKSRHWKYKR